MASQSSGTRVSKMVGSRHSFRLLAASGLCSLAPALLLGGLVFLFGILFRSIVFTLLVEFPLFIVVFFFFRFYLVILFALPYDLKVYVLYFLFNLIFF